MDTIWHALVIALLATVAVEAIVIVATLRLVGTLHEAIQRLVDDQQAAQPLMAGRALADGHFALLDGGELHLSSLWRDGNALIFFVSTGCVPCRDTLRAFATLADQTGAAGWHVGIVCAGPASLIPYLIADAGLPATIPVAVANQEQLARIFGIAMTPTAAVVDHGGGVRGVLTGAIDTPQLRHILLGAPIAVPAAA